MIKSTLEKVGENLGTNNNTVVFRTFSFSLSATSFSDDPETESDPAFQAEISTLVVNEDSVSSAVLC